MIFITPTTPQRDGQDGIGSMRPIAGTVKVRSSPRRVEGMGTEEVAMAYPLGAVERAMTAQAVILRAIAGQLTIQAADILGCSARSTRRWRLFASMSTKASQPGVGVMPRPEGYRPASCRRRYMARDASANDPCDSA
jgi:hypothetical protein